jgi:endonuclease/exonuclease/phosphatase family metal-dependent hydrolase
MESRRIFITSFVWATAFTCLLCIGFSSVALAESDKPTVRVMTRNMDAGTDLQYVAGASGLEEFIQGVYFTIAEVDDSNIAVRAKRLAAEIALTKPDLIALQEVTYWEIEDESGHRIYDQLQLLKNALRKAGQHYSVAAIQTLTDLPVDFPGLFNVRFTDFNAILVRTDLPSGHLMVLGSETHLYDYYLKYYPAGMELAAPNGWLAIDVKIRGERFKFANTHLLSAVPGAYFDTTAGVQLAQAEELLKGLSSSSLPIILAGDFNSAAEPSEYYPSDGTSSYGYIAANFLDAWDAIHPSDPGYTWPLFGEDYMSGYSVTPFERIDLIFSRGLKPLSVISTGTRPDSKGVYASDHVGVVADFDLENHRPNKPKGRR